MDGSAREGEEFGGELGAVMEPRDSQERIVEAMKGYGGDGGRRGPRGIRKTTQVSVQYDENDDSEDSLRGIGVVTKDMGQDIGMNRLR